MPNPLAENLFANLPREFSEEELVTILVNNPQVRIERIVSIGQCSPENFWYDQAEHEWVIVLQGEAKLRFEEGEPLHLKPGDHLLIPAHEKHRVEWTTPEVPTVWLGVFFQS
jgi:cupin 2 domain-containing protein